MRIRQTQTNINAFADLARFAIPGACPSVCVDERGSASSQNHTRQSQAHRRHWLQSRPIDDIGYPAIISCHDGHHVRPSVYYHLTSIPQSTWSILHRITSPQGPQHAAWLRFHEWSWAWCWVQRSRATIPLDHVAERFNCFSSTVVHSRGAWHQLATPFMGCTVTMSQMCRLLYFGALAFSLQFDS